MLICLKSTTILMMMMVLVLMWWCWWWWWCVDDGGTVGMMMAILVLMCWWWWWGWWWWDLFFTAGHSVASVQGLPEVHPHYLHYQLPGYRGGWWWWGLGRGGWWFWQVHPYFCVYVKNNSIEKHQIQKYLPHMRRPSKSHTWVLIGDPTYHWINIFLSNHQHHRT